MFSTKQEASKGWNYSWESWAKAGLLLTGVPACYYALKTTGLGFLSTWFSNPKSANDGKVALFKEDQDVHFQMPETGQVFLHIQSRKLLEHTEFDEPLTKFRIKIAGDPPVLVNNDMEVAMGETVVLDNTHLSATDIDDSDAALNFTISDEQHCQFEETVNPGVPITNFIQQQITNSEIQFVHDNSAVAPAYCVSVSDGTSSTQPDCAAVDFYSDTYVRYGTEFRVNTYTASHQVYPSVSSLSDGKFVVTWQSDVQDGSVHGIYGQIYNANGTEYGSEFRVNTYTTNNQFRTSVSSLSNGKFVVTWQSTFQDGDSDGIYGQMYNASGTKYGNEFRVNTYTASYQGYPSVSSLSDGKFVVTWQSDGQDGHTYGVYGQMYNANGTEYGNEFRVNTYTTTSAQTEPSVTGLSDGKFVVAWNDYDGNGSDIYGQMYNADGTEYGSEFRVNTYTTSSQSEPSVTGLSDGKFVVTWESNGQDGDGDGIYGQMYNVAGSVYGSEFRVNTGANGNPSIAGLSDGKFVVTCESWDQDQDFSHRYIYGQICNADGTTYGNEFRVNIYTTYDQIEPSVAGLSDGKFVVTCESIHDQDGWNYNIYGQMFEFGRNYAPQIVNHAFTINQDERIVITNAMLSATDANDAAGNIVFNLSNVQNGIFEVETSPNVWETKTSFTQQRVIDSEVRFVPGGGNYAPSFDITVSDYQLSSSPISANVTYSSYSQAKTGFQIWWLVLPLVLVGGCGVASLAGAIGFYKYKKNKRDAEEIALEDIKVEATASSRRSIRKEKTFSIKLGDIDQEEVQVPLIKASALKNPQRINAGAFGTIYRATWDKEPVVYKVLHGLVSEEESVQKDFEKEVGLLRKLTHPNIVRFYGVSKLSEGNAIVMEYVSGGSLQDVLYAETQAFPWIPSRYQIATDITNGLSYLHNNGVWHRDLKAGNILVTTKEEGMHAKLTDFGEAKIDEGSDKTATKRGTPITMAPEVMAEEKYSEKADVYSYGIVLWQIGTRDEPYKNVNQFLLGKAVMEGQRPPIPEELTRERPRYAELIARCWASDHRARPSMEEVAAQQDEIFEQNQSAAPMSQVAGPDNTLSIT